MFALRFWNISENHNQFEYYADYINTVATPNYDNLEKFKRFSNDLTLNGVNMLNIVRLVRVDYVNGLGKNEFNIILTELGLCYTTAYFLNDFQQKRIVYNRSQHEQKYGYLDVMEMSISPYALDEGQNITIVSLDQDD